MTLDMARVTESMLQVWALGDLDDLLDEISRNMSSYPPAALLMALNQSWYVRHHLDRWQDFRDKLSEHLTQTLGAERAKLLMRNR